MWKRAPNPSATVKVISPGQTARSQSFTAIPSPTLSECAGANSVTSGPFTGTREEDALTAQAILNLQGRDYPNNSAKEHSQILSTWMIAFDSSSKFIIRPSTANKHCRYSGVLASKPSSCVRGREECNQFWCSDHASPQSSLCYFKGASVLLWCTVNRGGRKSPVSTRANDAFLIQICARVCFTLASKVAHSKLLIFRQLTRAFPTLWILSFPRTGFTLCPYPERGHLQ